MADIDRSPYGAEHIGRDIHLTTLGGPRDGATLCGTTGRPSARRVKGCCQRCAAWSRTIATLREIQREAQATPYDVAREGL